MPNLARHLFDYGRPETPGDVVFFKLFEAFVAGSAVFLAWSWGLYARRISDVVMPLGVAQYVDLSFLYTHGLSLVNAGLISVLVLLGFLRRGRWAYFGAFLLLHVQFAARFALGKIPHSSNLLGMTLLGLALAAVVFSDARVRRRFTLGFTYFYLGLAYTLAAVSKLVGTGLSWPDGRHLWLWIYEKQTDVYAKTGVLDLNVVQELALAAPFVATAFLTIGLLTEASAFLLWWKPFRLPVLVGVLGLHVGIWLVMDILFYLSIIEVALLAFPWAVGLDRWLASTQGRVLQPLAQFAQRYG